MCCFFIQTLAKEIQHEQTLLNRSITRSQKSLPVARPRITTDYLKAKHANRSNRSYYLQERKRKRLEVAALKHCGTKPKDTFVSFEDPENQNIFIV